MQVLIETEIKSSCPGRRSGAGGELYSRPAGETGSRDQLSSLPVPVIAALLYVRKAVIDGCVECEWKQR
jgi:hypothetical protein